MIDEATAIESSSRFCINCGYNLHGISSDRCPECGHTFDAIPESPIPWIHRKKIGRLRTFISTVVLASLHPGKLAASVAAPEDAAAARRFRYIVIILAAIPLIVWLTMIGVDSGGTAIFSAIDLRPYDILPSQTPADRWWQFEFIWSAGSTLWGVLQFAILLALILATAAPRRLVDATSMPDHWRPRAASASYYLCAPLAMVFIPVSAIIVKQFVWHDVSFREPYVTLTPLLTMVAWLLVVIPLLYWWNTIRFTLKISRDDPVRGFFCGLAVPVGWAIAIGVAGGAVPFIIGFVWLLIDTFR